MWNTCTSIGGKYHSMVTTKCVLYSSMFSVHSIVCLLFDAQQSLSNIQWCSKSIFHSGTLILRWAIYDILDQRSVQPQRLPLKLYVDFTVLAIWRTTFMVGGYTLIIWQLTVNFMAIWHSTVYRNKTLFKIFYKCTQPTPGRRVHPLKVSREGMFHCRKRGSSMNSVGWYFIENR